MPELEPQRPHAGKMMDRECNGTEQRQKNTTRTTNQSPKTGKTKALWTGWWEMETNCFNERVRGKGIAHHCT